MVVVTRPLSPRRNSLATFIYRRTHLLLRIIIIIHQSRIPLDQHHWLLMDRLRIYTTVLLANQTRSGTRTLLSRSTPSVIGVDRDQFNKFSKLPAYNLTVHLLLLIYRNEEHTTFISLLLPYCNNRGMATLCGIESCLEIALQVSGTPNSSNPIFQIQLLLL